MVNVSCEHLEDDDTERCASCGEPLSGHRISIYNSDGIVAEYHRQCYDDERQTETQMRQRAERAEAQLAERDKRIAQLDLMLDTAEESMDSWQKLTEERTAERDSLSRELCALAGQYNVVRDALARMMDAPNDDAPYLQKYITSGKRMCVYCYRQDNDDGWLVHDISCPTTEAEAALSRPLPQGYGVPMPEAAERVRKLEELADCWRGWIENEDKLYSATAALFEDKARKILAALPSAGDDMDSGKESHAD